MPRAILLSLLLLVAVVLEVTIMPMVSISHVSVSLVAVGVASLVMLGIFEPAFIWAIGGGALLDLLAPPPFGIKTLIFLGVWALLFAASRYRLVTSHPVVVGLVMVLVGLIQSIPDMIVSFDWLTLASYGLSYSFWGTLFFLALARLVPKEKPYTYEQSF
jgi:hypothetical protein